MENIKAYIIVKELISPDFSCLKATEPNDLRIKLSCKMVSNDYRKNGMIKLYYPLKLIN